MLGVVAFLRTHGANAIGQARQHGEEAWQHRIGPLRDVAVALEHVVGTRVEELRVLVQEDLELGACALEPRGRDRFVHRLADTRDLGEPEIVDLARRELRRRVEREPRLVVATTRRQCRGRDVGCRDGQVALVVELAQLAERRNNGHLDRAPSGGRQALALGSRNVRRKLLERRVLRTLRRIGDDLGVELRRDARDGDLGGHPAELHPQFHPRDELVDQRWHGVQARDVRLVVAHRPERRCVDEAGQFEVDTTELRDG